MIGYFTLEGDVEVGEHFNPYLDGFRDVLKNRFANREYGKELTLILVEYHLEGKQLKSIPDSPIVLPYRKKECSLGVAIGVPRSFKDFSDYEKKKFIIDTTLEAVNLSYKKMSRLGYSKINFDSLINDVKECAMEYLKIDIVSGFKRDS
jgi:hypothetical protein